MKEQRKVSQWSFMNDSGEFILQEPQKTGSLYFPLANEAGMMSAVSPLLGGDSKTGQDTFLLQPASADDLHSSSVSRNFWIRINDHEIWSATGNSLVQKQRIFEEDPEETVSLEAGFLWHKIIRNNSRISVKSEITNFVPVSEDQVELMLITLTNTGEAAMQIEPTAAIPIFGRSASNLRDHRHVTSLLNRIYTNDYGVIVNPTLTFDERGHRTNTVFYTVLGVSGEGERPIGFFPVQEDFIGEGASFDWPEAIVKKDVQMLKSGDRAEGYEAMGGLRFETVSLGKGESVSYVIAMGISEGEDDSARFLKAYGSVSQVKGELERNRSWWKKKLSPLTFHTGDQQFDRWMKWVEVQPVLRRIFGCSFLPHHDYGRGGRGWRDLWQDCLALLLLEPEQVRDLLLNNYAGVRFDGSNATIIGMKKGEFLADRNNIPRTWMDHGAWPFLTTALYLDLSGDLDFLLEEQVYFKDSLCSRSRQRDPLWKEEYGCCQRDDRGDIYKGTILEHMLLEQVSAFYNVGEHNIIRLEGADWNDGFDMAADRGESVAFMAFYGGNLREFERLLKSLEQEKGIHRVLLAKEILPLLDTMAESINYESVEAKNRLLEKYFTECRHNVSGEKLSVSVQELCRDLRIKAEWITEHIRKAEWLGDKEDGGWFNGYYDNNGQRVEGNFASGVRLILTGQVFTIMGGVADEDQIARIIRSVNRYLRDETVGGIRLNSKFDEVKLDMGRCFGFAFGHKENGAMFSHMAIMYVNALYRRGFIKEGYEILDMIYRHACDFDKSRIYPGIPEYFNDRGRGMYHYLTGAASWLLLTMRNEVFGIKGQLGDLRIEPKLVRAQFDEQDRADVYTVFADRKLNIAFYNRQHLEIGEYCIGDATLDGRTLDRDVGTDYTLIRREELGKLEKGIVHDICIELVRRD